MTSMDEIRQELDVELRAQTRRAASAETRSCVLLAASGAVAGLAAIRTACSLPGAAVALAAAVRAAGAVRPAHLQVFDPVNLRRLYAAEAPEVTRQAVLDRRVADFERHENALDHQLRRLRSAASLLLAAIALVVVGDGLPLLLTFLNK